MWETLISKPCPLPPSEERDKLLEKYKKILSDVREIIDNDEIIKKIIAEYPNIESESQEDYEINRKERIKKVLEKAGYKRPVDMDLYAEALKTNMGGYSIVLERDITEI